jgi:Rrf2 family protein
MFHISARTEYACVAMLDLARHFEQDDPVRIREIAGRHGIPSRFLVQILLQLKAAGLVQSIRGAGGGYRLAREPQEITLLDVMRVINAQPEKIAGNATSNSAVSEVLQGSWQHVSDAGTELLEALTLGELAEKSGSHSIPMYYI